MQSKATTVEEYLKELPIKRQEAMRKIRKAMKDNIPKGFEEGMGYGMMGWDVPHSLYPAGYHCDPKQPLPFIGLASQKNFIAIYHMGIYADKKLHDWFVSEYAKVCKTKLDMGKSCIRLKKTDDIPYKLIGELSKKMTVEDWINLYESTVKNSRKTK